MQSILLARHIGHAGTRCRIHLANPDRPLSFIDLVIIDLVENVVKFNTVCKVALIGLLNSVVARIALLIIQQLRLCIIGPLIHFNREFFKLPALSFLASIGRLYVQFIFFRFSDNLMLTDRFRTLRIIIIVHDDLGIAATHCYTRTTISHYINL